MEWFVILLVALVVLGPARLPEMARKVGNWTAEMRRAANEIRQGLEAEVGDVREIARDIREPLREVQDTVRDTKKVIDADLAPKTWVGPKPMSGPTPEDAMADLERINAVESLIEPPEDIPSDHEGDPPVPDVAAAEAPTESADVAEPAEPEDPGNDPRVEGGAA